ncbi:MAG: glycosyltransferase family 4 protein [Methylacidiphilales bacterium]|nr:glycosyltransferase family 4 protein [Candidatus Methylacidiphilales bacterium]
MKPAQVLILNDYAHINGGASAVALHSAVALARRGIHVVFFAAAGPVSDILSSEPNIEVHCLNQCDILHEPNRFRAMFRGIYNRQALKQLDALLQQLTPQESVIHVHSWTKALSPAVLGLAGRSSHPMVVTLHDYFISCPNGGFFIYPREKACHLDPLSPSCLACNCDRRNILHKQWRVLRTVFQNKIWQCPQHADHFIFVSAFMKERLQSRLPPHIPQTIIEAPIQVPQRPRVEVSKNKNLVFCGRLVPEKGPHLLAEAASGKNWPVVYIGDGEMRPRLEQYGRNIRITGWLNAEQMDLELRQARALVFPSQWPEPFGITVFEAAAHGVPVVVSRHTAPADLLHDGIQALHFETSSIPSLQTQLEKLESDERVDSLGRQAYDWFWKQPFGPDQHLDRLLDVYRAALDVSP